MKFRVSPLTLEEFRQILSYDPDTGEFRWLVQPRRSVPKGAVAGYLVPTGYRHIGIKTQKYPLHRIAWLFITGVWPSADIDHINGVRSDNRAANLREATRAQNLINAPVRKDSKSGVRGVYFHKVTGKWVASCGVNGRQKHLGVFETIELASQAYQQFAEAHYGQYCHPANRAALVQQTPRQGGTAA
jgi:hypothetical protein